MERWDGDERGEGVADAAAFADEAARLVDVMRRASWVAEEPEVHLLPHVERACASLPLEIVDAGTAPDGAFELRLRWTGGKPSLGEIRTAVFSLIGAFAEPATSIRQVGGAEFEVVTGFLDGDGAFAAHGHTVRIGVR